MRAAASVVAAAILLAGPAFAQVCDPEKGTVAGSVKVGDRSTPPCDLVDLWAVPENGTWISLGKFAWGEINVPVPPGTWRFAAYACDTYFPFRQSAPVRCARDAQGCVTCGSRFEIAMYGMFGGFSGQVTLLPENVPAEAGIPVAAASGVTCGAEKFAYTDDNGRFVVAPEIEPHRSNHWGLMVDGDGSEMGSRTYFLNADYCENGVTATTFSSTDVAVNLFRAAPYLAASDPSLRPLPLPPLFPARPPHEAAPGISLTTGNVYLDQTDVTAWGASSSVGFRRSYNSRLASQRRLTSLGPGWSHTFSAQITTPATHVLLLFEDDGSPRYFQDSDGDRTYRASVPVTEPSTIVKTRMGYSRRFTDGGVEEFDGEGRLVRRTDAVGRTTTILRDDQGRLATVTDADGRRLTFTYGTEGYLTRVGSGSFNVADYAHDEDGRLRGVTYPNGAGFTFTYDDASQMLTMGERNGPVLRTYTYDGNRARSFETSGGRDRVSLEYGPLKTTATDVLGRVSTYEWINVHGLRMVTGVTGRCADCGPAPVDPLDPNPTPAPPPMPTPRSNDSLPTWARLLQPPWPAAEWSGAAVDWPVLVHRTAERHAWTYDLQGRLLSHRDGGGLTTHVAYDTSGWPITITDTLGRVVRLAHDAAGRITSITAPSVANPRLQRSTSYAYDTKGRLSSRVDAGFHGDGTPFRIATQLTYDDAGRLITIDGPRVATPALTRYAYDTAGNLIAVSQVPWLVERFDGHNAFGWPQRRVDAGTRAVVYTYGPQGRVTGIDDGGDVTAFEYTASGRVRRVGLPRGNGAIYAYDAYGRLVEARNAADQRLSYTYDMAGQRTRDQIRGPLAGSERERAFDYDRFGRVVRVSVPEGRYEIGYDPGGQVTSFRAPGSEPVLYQFDPMGRLVSVQHPGGLQTALRYDARDQLVAATDHEGAAFTYSYDDLGRLFRRVTPAGAATLFGYDPAGRLAWRTDARGVTMNHERDEMGRVVATRFTTDRSITYRYDDCPNGRGRVCEVTDQSGRTTFLYTPRGQVAEEVRHAGSVSLPVSYSYDRNGNISSVRYPSGRVVTYTWDEADRPRSVSTAASGPMQAIANLSYGPDGDLAGITYANGVSVAYGRDGTGRVRAMQGGIVDLTYSYDPRGNVVAIGGPDRAQTFAYDAASRLIGASGPWGALSWTYDAAGNRLGETGRASGATYVYEPRTQRLTSMTASDVTAFGYDAGGRMVRAGEDRFVYDDLGQLVMVGGRYRTGEYAYDYKGRRAWKSAGGVTTLFTYDVHDRLIAESARDGTVQVEYIYDGRRPIARATRSGLSYVHVDALETPIALTDASGERLWSAEPHPFGDVAPPRATPTPRPTAAARSASGAPAAPSRTAARPAVSFPLRSGGRYFDDETGLLRDRFRTYDPRLGRYLEPNPCARPAEPLSHGLYTYAGQNPLAFAAPEGLDPRLASAPWSLPPVLWDALLPSAGGASPECTLASPSP